MKSTSLKGILLLTAVAAVGAYFWFEGERLDDAMTGKPFLEEQAPVVVSSPSASGSDTIKNDTQVNEHLQFIEFQNRARQLFDHADTLNEQQKQAELKAIQDAAKRYEEQGKLVAMEALLLKLAMLQYTTNGEQEYKDQAQALIESYKAISDAKEQEWLNNPDPRFVDYKRREQDIVKDVMAMTVIPDGLSRDEYLRQQLEQARIAAMGDGEG